MTADVHRRTIPVMGTTVTIEVVGHGRPAADITDAIDRAFGWFYEIEARCTRFESTSELMRLTARAGTAVRASDLLFEAVRFALALAEDTGGAFDPTVGLLLEQRGFNREYRTGRLVRSAIDGADGASYRDVELDDERRTIRLRRPLILDLGAVAKGLAIDTAACGLAPFEHFAIDAGGDLYLGGRNAQDGSWAVGIRHPRIPGQLIETVHVTNRAVCTSGDYEQRVGGSDSEEMHHIVDPRTGKSADAVASVTVIAPTAMAADALATAAFVLGPEDGLRLFERHGVEGLIVSPSLERWATRGFGSDSASDQPFAPASCGA